LLVLNTLQFIVSIPVNEENIFILTSKEKPFVVGYPDMLEVEDMISIEIHHLLKFRVGKTPSKHQKYIVVDTHMLMTQLAPLRLQ